MALANSGIPLSEWSGSGAVRELHESIKQFNDVATEQGRTMIRLTRWIRVLTIVMTLAVLVQIALMWRTA
jgi:hypothetical protein